MHCFSDIRDFTNNSLLLTLNVIPLCTPVISLLINVFFLFVWSIQSHYAEVQAKSNNVPGIIERQVDTKAFLSGLRN